MAQMPRGQAGPWLRAPGACRGCCHPRILPRERETRPGPLSASKQQILVRVEDPQLTDGCYELGWLWGVVGPLEPGPPSPLWGRIAGLPAEDLGHPAGNSRPAGGDTPPELVLQARGSKPPLRKIVSSKGLNSKWFHFPFP